MRQLKKLRELWTGMFSKPVYGSCGGGDPAVWEESARRKAAEPGQQPTESAGAGRPAVVDASDPAPK
jgi:hypothetical protein